MKKRYFHELEALLSERNTDYRDAEDYAQHKIRESRLPAEEYEPEDIGYRMSIKIRAHYFADGRETCRAYLKALRAEGYADYRDTQEQTHEPPAERGFDSYEKKPYYIAYCFHKINLR